MGLISVDTTFLIDLQRDQSSTRRAIREFLKHHADDIFCVSVTALGEFAAGFPDLHHPAFLAFKGQFQVSEHDDEVAFAYAKIYRHLKTKGTLIGANDLWIAASALRHQASLVTRNIEDFKRIPGLMLLSY
jgi:predicted nucleic acid-binding protein